MLLCRYLHQSVSSVAHMCTTPCDPMDCSTLGFSVHHQLLENVKVMSKVSVIPSSHLILYCSLLLLPSNFLNIRIFLNESVLCIAGQGLGVLASASVLPMNTQDWFPLWLTTLISLQYKGLSRVFSNTTVQKHQFFSTQLSL